MNTISVILPTIARPTLQAAIESCKLHEGDEVIVMYDSERKDMGNSARTRAMSIANGTHLAFLDDDDVFTEDALNLMHDAACDQPVIFKMDSPQHGILWDRPEVFYGNVGTPMFLIPNIHSRLGRWTPYADDKASDFTFIKETIGKMGDPIWRPEVTCIVRPHER